MKKILLFSFTLFLLSFSINAQTTAWGTMYGSIAPSDSALVGVYWYGYSKNDTNVVAAAETIYATSKASGQRVKVTPVMIKELLLMEENKRRVNDAAINSAMNGKASISNVDTAKSNIRSEMSSNITATNNNINYVRSISDTRDDSLKRVMDGKVNISRGYVGKNYPNSGLFSVNDSFATVKVNINVYDTTMSKFSQLRCTHTGTANTSSIFLYQFPVGYSGTNPYQKGSVLSGDNSPLNIATVGDNGDRINMFVGNTTNPTVQILNKGVYVNPYGSGVDIQVENTFEVRGTDAMRIPNGTTSERPTSTRFGQMRYNTTLGRGEMYVNDLNGDGTQGDEGWRVF